MLRRTLALVCLLALLAPLRALGEGAWELEVVADTGTLAPGTTSDFILLRVPALEGGRLAFSGLATGPGLWLLEDGDLEQAAGVPASAAPGLEGVRDYGEPALAGDALAVRVASERGGEEGVYVARDGALAPLVAVASDTGRGFRGFGELWLGPDALVFQAVESRPEPNQGIWRVDRGGLSLVVDERTEAPGSAGRFQTFASPALDGDAVFFHAKCDAAEGIYLSIGGALRAVVTSGAPRPGRRDAFEGFEGVAARGGAAVLVGRGADGVGVYRFDGEDLARVADTRSRLPERSDRFTGFASAAVDGPLVAFHGRGADLHEGIYARRFTSPPAPLEVVVERGARLDGRRVATVELGRQAVSGDEIAFRVTYEDGAQALVLARPEH